MTIDRRWVPGIKYEDVIKQYQDIIDELAMEDEQFKCTLKVMENSVMKDGYVHEPMETDINHPIVNISMEKVKEVLDIETKITFFPAWSDGGLLSSYGNIPTIVFAPGDLKTAHSADEHMDIKQILPATLIYALIANEFCK